MNEQEIKRILPRASRSVVDLNCSPQGADVKLGSSDGPLAARKAKEGNPRKCMVRITSYRARLADVDGLCGKWHLDALRYAGIIEDDTEEAITYQISQKKVTTKGLEKTLIEVEY